MCRCVCGSGWFVGEYECVCVDACVRVLTRVCACIGACVGACVGVCVGARKGAYVGACVGACVDSRTEERSGGSWLPSHLWCPNDPLRLRNRQGKVSVCVCG